MVDTLSRQEPTLVEFVTDRARRASDLRLALNAGVGLAVAAGVGFWRPPGWIALIGLALTFGAYGVWAIADRELSERREGEGKAALLRGLRRFAAVTGALAGLTFIAAILGMALGPIIS
jgi:hypothetical protein